MKGNKLYNSKNEILKHKYYSGREKSGTDKRYVNGIVTALYLFDKVNELKCHDGLDIKAVEGFKSYLEQSSKTRKVALQNLKYVRDYFFWLKKQVVTIAGKRYSYKKKIDLNVVKKLKLEPTNNVI